MPNGPLSAALLDQLAGPIAAAVAALPELEALLDRALAAARAAWPEVHVTEQRFAAQVARAVTSVEDAAMLPHLRLVDLYLTAAVCDRDPVAVRAATTHYRPELAAALRHLNLAPLQADDVIQSIWENLLLDTELGEPRIARYRGQGDLRRWLRVSALRAAYRQLERSGRDASFDDDRLDALPDPGIDPELDVLKRRSLADFRAAFHAAIAALTPRQRTLLRRHHLDGMTIDDLGALYRVHRATAARWIAEARDDVLFQTKRELRQRLQISDAELASMLDLIRSRLDVSLERVLASSEED
jgi:RNA polymerase sigma-70 factor (ECF subfamily)